ncbi:recombinase family protein [Actinoplanes sp. NPDC023936]|uniref:recombinase family protein n=1 Tax=Actinoplanes sp. NPDC023936 TaxID=3154910 RepID=UPI0033CEE671
MDATPPVADLYARKSNKDGGRSVARQERSWRIDCAQEGITPGRVFVDPHFSASRYARKSRPDYKELLAHIESASCQMVSLFESARGARQMGEWVYFLDRCRDFGVLIRVYGEDEPVTYDPRRQRDRDALMKDGMAAEGESERLSVRTRAGITHSAHQGRPHGKVPDGYKRLYTVPVADEDDLDAESGKLHIDQVIDEPRAEIYRAAAEGILNGVPVDFIARVLTAWEVPTPRGGKRWSGGALYNSLIRPSMEGHRELNGAVITRNAWPPILSSDTVNRLRRLREAPRPSRSHNDTRLKYMLSGAVLCGLCRKPMSGLADRRTRQNRYECQASRGGCCRVSVLLDPVDDVVNAMIAARLREPDALAVFEASSVADQRIVAAQAKLDGLKDRHNELTASAARPGGPSMSLVAAAERELLPQIEAASRQLRQLRTPPALQGFDPADLARRWLEYPVGERRLVANTLAEVVVSPVGRGGKWSPWRLEQSRWRSQDRTWGDIWRERGLAGVGA